MYNLVIFNCICNLSEWIELKYGITHLPESNKIRNEVMARGKLHFPMVWMHFTYLGTISTYVGFSMSKLSIVYFDTMNRRLEDEDDEEVLFERIMMNYL